MSRHEGIPAAAFLDPALLRDPAWRTARVIAQGRLKQVLTEAVRVPDLLDLEAIHDFRVALRQLRAWLRAFRPVLADTVRHEVERRLKEFSRLAGEARDLEVQCGWLTVRGPVTGAAARDAAAWLVQGVGSELERSRRVLTERLRREFPRAIRQLSGGLQRHQGNGGPGSHPAESMTMAMAEAIRRSTVSLRRDLKRVRRLDQVAEAHSARIAVKRLRYLLLGFGTASPSATGIVAQLTTLQDRFGELHDGQELQRRLREARERGGVGRPPPNALKALGLVLAHRVAIAFRRTQGAIRSKKTAVMFARLEALIERLERKGSTA